GIVHLQPLQGEPDLTVHDQEGWKSQLRDEVKSLFALAKAGGRHVREAGGGSGACLIAATAMGVTFLSDHSSGLSDHSSGDLRFPDHGAIAGLMKTLAIEWPEVSVKVVDLNLDHGADTLAQQLFEELHAEDGAVEVGYNGKGRITLEPFPAPLRGERQPAA